MESRDSADAFSKYRDTLLQEFAIVTSRDLWCKSMVRQMVAQFAKEIHKFMCPGVENDLKTSLFERNRQFSHVQWCNKKSWEGLRRPDQLISLRKLNNNHNNTV